MSAPNQYSQSSRKGKKAWRKHVDIRPVEEGLENVRDEIIAGGIIAEKPSEDLFAHDTVGSDLIQKSYIKRHKTLKADEILAQRSSVPGLSVQPHKKRKTLPRAVIRRQITDVLNDGRVSATSEVSSVYDVWSSDLTPSAQSLDPQFSYLQPPQPVKTPETFRHKPVSQTASGRAIPAVPRPVAGKSYNPQFADWEYLLETEGTKEVTAERKRRADAIAHQALLEKQAQVAATGGDRMNGEFTGQIEDEDDEESIWEGISEAEENPEWAKTKKAVRKTKAQRNKIERHKEALRKVKADLRQKQKAAQMSQIRALAKEVERRAILRREDPIESDEEMEDAEDVTLRKRTSGKAPIPQQRLELVLPDELQDSLRLLKPEGNLLEDRWRNMLIRGKLESRKPVGQLRKKRVKETEKWSYKDWKLH